LGTGKVALNWVSAVFYDTSTREWTRTEAALIGGKAVESSEVLGVTSRIKRIVHCALAALARDVSRVRVGAGGIVGAS
jgi:hypothetical protein